MSWQAWVRAALQHLPLRPLIGGVSQTIKRAVWNRRRRAYRNARQEFSPGMPLESLPQTAPSPRKGPRFLIAMNAGIGNAIEATPLVKALRVQMPHAHLTLWHPGGDLFDDWSVADRLVNGHEELAGEAFERTFITYSSNVEALKTTQLGHISRIACLHERWLVAPERAYNCDLAREIGFKDVTPALYVSTRAPAQPIPDAHQRICIIPGGKKEFRWRNKRWPHFAGLMDMLVKQYAGVQLCILGGKDDEPDLRLPPHALDFRNKLSLRETAWVLRHATLAIGNDCGPMHIADAVGCPSVVIFGPTCELKNGPINRAIVLTNEVACRPCQYGELLMTCNNPICMKDLSPTTVLTAIGSILAATAGAQA